MNLIEGLKKGGLKKVLKGKARRTDKKGANVRGTTVMSDKSKKKFLDKLSSKMKK